MSRIAVQLLGTLTVTGPGGEDLTPRGAKVCGLLALLAVAKGRWCSRAWLQDKLWSDRGQRQGQDSLRHAVADLRAALGAHAGALRVEGRNLGLDRERVLIDLHDALPPGIDPAPAGATFLEGIDIRDREFDAWLRGMRDSLHERPPQPPGDSPFGRSGFRVALLPIESFAHDDLCASLAASIVARVATSLGNLGPFAVYDFSDGNIDPRSAAEAPDAFLSVRSLQLRDALNVSLSLRRVADSKIIWSAMQVIPIDGQAGVAVAALVIQVTDQIARVLYQPGVLGPAERHQAARFALSGIDKMFSLGASSLAEADAAFARATEIEQKGVYLAWHAYLTVFRSGELPNAEGEDIRAFAISLAERALALDGNNPLTLALLAQVYAFVFRDFHKAQALIEPAMAMSPDSLMTLDSFALLNFYTGNLEMARNAATRAMDVALYNPYRYCFATTLCMIDTVGGDPGRAVEHGERALAMHPPGARSTYAPTLRYLAAAYENADRPDDARRVYDALVQQEPELDAGRVDAGEYPVPNARAREVLAGSFRRIESRAALTRQAAGRTRAPDGRAGIR